MCLGRRVRGCAEKFDNSEIYRRANVKLSPPPPYFLFLGGGERVRMSLDFKGTEIGLWVVRGEE